MTIGQVADSYMFGIGVVLLAGITCAVVCEVVEYYRRNKG